MMRESTNDLDYLVARLHGRRSRMAEGERLERLCRIRNLPDLAGAIFPDTEFHGIIDLQRQLVYRLAREISGFTAYLAGSRADLLDWILIRFQVQNLKILIRAYITKTPVEEARKHLVPLSKELTVDAHILETADSLAGFVGLTPKGKLRKSFEKTLEIHRDTPRPFFFEAALDSGYFHELLARVNQLSGEEREIIGPVVCQEIDIFHLMLVIRGKFHYGLASDSLLPFHVSGTGIPRARLAAMLNDPDMSTAVERALGRAVDELPSEYRLSDTHGQMQAAHLETLARNRLLRLSRYAFRKNHLGLGAVVGYIIIRLAETANIITISEGIRHDMSADTIRARFTPQAQPGGVHV